MVSEEDLVERIQHMMARPRMWAQSVESFEDQIVMLLDFLGGDVLSEYRLFCRNEGCRNGTLASNYTTFNSMQIKLKEFIDTKVDTALLKGLKLDKAD